MLSYARFPAALRIPRPPRAVALTLAASVLVTGCTGAPVPADSPTDPPADPRPGADSPARQARDQLAARAAAAADRRLTASYVWSAPDRPDRTVTVVEAIDGSWRVDIPGGALAGTVDVAMVRTDAGLFQCVPPLARPDPSGCVRIADPDGPPPAESDPRVQHVFTDWRSVLLDRRAPLAVAAGQPLPATDGECYSVGSTSASLAAPLAVGVYCYRSDGTLTGVRLDLGTLRLAGPPGAAPATVDLPGPVVTGDPLPVGAAAPPSDGMPAWVG